MDRALTGDRVSRSSVLGNIRQINGFIAKIVVIVQENAFPILYNKIKNGFKREE